MMDLKFALRTLRNNPGYTLIAALILALGIGGTTVIFSAVNAVLLRPLPFPQPERIVSIREILRGKPSVASPPNFTDWRAQNSVFSGLAAINEGAFALTGSGPAEQISGAMVTGDFFRVMGVAPVAGRTISPSDAVLHAPPVAVIGSRLWKTRFGGDRNVIGTAANFDGTSYTIVGVMPDAFAWPDGSEVWLPLAFTADELTTQRGAHYLDVVGRLKDGVTLDKARTEMRQIAGRLAVAYPNTNPQGSAEVRPLRESVVGNVRPAMLILLGSVVLVLLIACTNVAALTLARSAGRVRELALRAALGARRIRIARGLLLESLLLAGIGGTAGVLLAFWGSKAIAAIHGIDIPFLAESRLDLRVLAFAVTVTLITGILVGILPALQSSSIAGLAQRLKEGTAGSGGSRRPLRVRNALVVIQTALAVVLLVGAVLLMRSFTRLQQVTLGYDAHGVLTFGISLPDASYATPESRAQYTDRLLERLQALPGVDAAGAVFGLPLSGMSFGISGYEVDGRHLDNDEQDRLSVQVRTASPQYFRAMGIPIVRGRGIEPSDRAGAPPVIVINESAARLIWPDVDPLGHRFTIGAGLGRKGEHAGGEVVGVIGDLKEFGPSTPSRPEIFVSQAQYAQGYLAIVLRTRGTPEALVPGARAALAAIDPDIPMFHVRTMQQLADDAVGKPRLYSILLGVFAVMAIFLAAIGLYGILMQSIAQRTREIGVRMALGAGRVDLVRMVMRQSMLLGAFGVGSGVVIAILATRLIRRLLFGVQPLDPTTFAVVIAVLTLVTIVASALPARRATRMDPVVALRTE